MIRNLAVAPVHYRREIVGYRVEGIIRDCPDSLWETIGHIAIFRTQERAERLLAKILATQPWDLKLANWRRGCSFDASYSVL